MNAHEATARHAELVEEIRRHDHAYYVLAQPTISDREYDRLYQELLDLEKQLPLLVTPESPSQRVGGEPVGGFNRVQHLEPMLSLEKIKASKTPDEKQEPDVEKRKQLQDENTLLELPAWDQSLQKQLHHRIDYVIEPKVDGVSIAVHYRHGKLALGVTRGDGSTGDDITSNLKTVRGIPLQLRLKNPPALLEVRGEAYISKADFEKLNAKIEATGERSFPNARNATAGTLKQLDPRTVAERPIKAVFYSVGACEGISFRTHSEVLESLKKFGLPTQPEWWVCKGMEEVLTCYRQRIVCGYDEKRDLRSRVPYDIDGIVVKVNDLRDWQKIPAKARAPGYAIVHKPIPWITPAETLLKGITVQVGRTGVLTPVAELEPVFVQGSTISRATLHNEDEIRRKDVRIGDTVIIRKAGMVIPEVVEVLKSKRPEKSSEFDLYAYVGGKCPACGGAIKREEVSLKDKKEVAWRCQNVAGCPAQKTRRIEYFAQRKALDIEALGGIVAEKLVDSALAKEPLDLFQLSKESLARLNLGTDEEPRVFGEKNAAKVVAAAERARSLPLSRWLFAIGIPNVGEQIALELSRLHSDLKDLANSELLCAILQKKDKPSELREEFTRRLAKNTRLSLQAERIAANQKAESDRLSAELRQAEEELKEPKEALALINKKLRQLKKSQSLTTELSSTQSEQERIEKNVKRLKKKTTSLKGRIKTIQEALPFAGLSAEIGVVVAQSINSYFRSATGRELLTRLDALRIAPKGESAFATTNSEKAATALAGQTFVITGTLEAMSRDEAAEEIRKRGGAVTNSVTRNTTYLVVGADPGATKTNQAEALGVKQLTENEFLAMLKVDPKPKNLGQQNLF